MLSINLDVPEALLFRWDGSKEAIKKELQKMLAIRLFEVGMVTTGQAAEMCDMNRVDFMFELSGKGIPIVDWTEKEIQSELENALKLCE
jgi:predicted HTH domain antitoxin